MIYIVFNMKMKDLEINQNKLKFKISNQKNHQISNKKLYRKYNEIKDLKNEIS